MNQHVFMLLHRLTDEPIRKMKKERRIRITSQPRHINSEQTITGLEINACKLLKPKSKISNVKANNETLSQPKLGNYTLNDLCKKYSSQFFNNSQLLRKINKAQKHFSVSRRNQLMKIEPRDKLLMTQSKIGENSFISKESAKDLYIGQRPCKKNIKIFRFRNIFNLNQKTRKANKSQLVTLEQNRAELSKTAISLDKIIKSILKESPPKLPSIKPMHDREDSLKMEQTETLYTSFRPITDGDIIIRTKHKIKDITST